VSEEETSVVHALKQECSMSGLVFAGGWMSSCECISCECTLDGSVFQKAEGLLPQEHCGRATTAEKL